MSPASPSPVEPEPGTEYHSLRVAAVIEETPDARSYVLDIPGEVAERFRYQAGQFLTFRIPWGTFQIARCYSLSSSPVTGEPPKVTVKRVHGGRMSNWLIDRLGARDRIEARPPAGTFVLHAQAAQALPGHPGGRPLALFAAGSGITPIISLIKAALVTTRRPIRLAYANCDTRSIIFRREIDALARAHSDRLEVHHHLDDRSGLPDMPWLESRVRGLTDAEFYICGPTPFMDLVETGLDARGVARELLHCERFVSAVDPDRLEAEGAPPPPEPAQGPVRFRLTLDGRTQEVPYLPGRTLLQSARAAGVTPPFSCEEGFCGCCKALLREGRVEMAHQHAGALSRKELAAGYVLACQSRPVASSIWLDYDDV